MDFLGGDGYLRDCIGFILHGIDNAHSLCSSGCAGVPGNGPVTLFLVDGRTIRR